MLGHRCAGLRIVGRQLTLVAVSQRCDIPYVADAVCRRSGLSAVSVAFAKLGASMNWNTAVVSTTSPAIPEDYVLDTSHKAPVVNCTCGFYAVPVDLPLPTMYEDSPVELFVELSGRVIESDRKDGVVGVVYRAGRQRVVEMRLRPCPFCGLRSTGVYVEIHGRRVTTQTCGRHGACGGQVVVELEDMQRMCPVPIVAKPAIG